MLFLKELTRLHRYKHARLASFKTYEYIGQVRKHHVTIVGGTTRIGQTLSMLLRTDPRVDTLMIHDSTELTHGYVDDLSHIPGSSKLKVCTGDWALPYAIKNSDLVLAVGGSTTRPGVSLINRVEANLNTVRNVAIHVSRTSPLPFLGIITQPVNCIVPIMAETMKTYGFYNPRKLFGISEINAIRAQALLTKMYKIAPGRKIDVPIIGGYSSGTIVPLLSQTRPNVRVESNDVDNFTMNLRKLSRDIVLITQAQGWSTTLSLAFSVYHFAHKILNVLDGKKETVNAYVENDKYGTDFFSGQVKVDMQGHYDLITYPKLMDTEKRLLDNSIKKLEKEIMIGKRIAQSG